MNRIAFALASLVLSSSLVACRGGDDSPMGDDTPMVDAPPVAGEVTIQEIQNDAMPKGTAVEVKGVVVTAIDSYGNKTGDFWVQEPGGGAFSGVKVFGGPLDQVGALAVGDIVDITGAQKEEFAFNAMPGDPTVTELKPVTNGTMSVTKVGSGAALTPDVVDAAAIFALPTKPARDAEWEKWEGVLIKATKVRQTTDISTFGSTPGPDSTEFRGTGFVRVQSALVELPATGVFGTCYESITGVGDFFFNPILAPRSAADVVAGGTACLPLATSVSMIQSSASVELINLTNVFVTGRDDIANNALSPSYGYWIADSLTAAANSGVLVFTGNDAPVMGLVPGAKIATMRGSVTEFDLGSNMMPAVGNTITEIANPIIGAITAPTGGPTGQPIPATTATVAQLADIGAAGEAWEGVLVRIGPVKVTMANAMNGKIKVKDTTTMAEIHIDDDSFVIPAQAMDACISVTGLMSVAIFDDLRTINPRSAADVTTAVGCL